VSSDGYFILSAETTFSAAHRLPGAGECEQLHGHNWRIRLNVRVDESRLDGNGMGVDFRIIEQVVREAVTDFDHAYLNDLAPFQNCPPTAELIAREVCLRAQKLLEESAPIVVVAEVEAWEMAGYRAAYRPA
jgi:6-pyruvoyltetrahydropterin/6-carboxytetrahydropterin synthase